MRIDKQDWKAFVGHLNATLDLWSHWREPGSRRQLRRKYQGRQRRRLACDEGVDEMEIIGVMERLWRYPEPFR